MKVLAGDIGGTKTLLCIVEFSATSANGEVIAEQRYDSGAYPGLQPMIEEFLATIGKGKRPINKACFGVAGPIIHTPEGQSVKVTNLPWQFDSNGLAKQLGIKKLALVNDFQAIGYGIEALAAQDLRQLQAGTMRARNPRLVIGPGTGLGMGIMYWQDDHYEVMASEGGHVDFAPTEPLQIELLHYLLRRFGHVSYERILSGSGLVHIYEFLSERQPERANQVVLAGQGNGDPAAAISQAALDAKDAVAVQAVQLFAGICGAYAGNLALICLPYGGVYIAGGIAPKLIDIFTDGAFMSAFTNKGRMGSLLAAMPVQVVLNTKIGLMGAALAARRL